MADTPIVSKIRADITDYKSGMSKAVDLAKEFGNTTEKVNKEAGGGSREPARQIKENYTSGFDGAKRAAQGFSTFLSNLKDRVIAFAVYDIGKNLVRGFKDSIKEGIQYNAMMETSNTKWVNLLGTQEKAKETQKIINDLAAKTPYDYVGLDKFAMKLEMAGLGGANLEKNMIAVGDAVAAVGGGSEALDGVSLALSQMMMKGKVSAEEMQQLAERGIPAWDLLAKSMGLTKAEVIKLAGEGKVLSEDIMPGLLDQMSATFGGSMATQAETFNGKMSTLQDTIAITKGELAKPIFEILKKPMQWLIDNIPKIPDKLEGFIGKVKSLEAVFGTIDFGKVIQDLKDFGSYLDSKIDFKGTLQSAKDLAKTIGDNLYNAFNTVKPVVMSVADYMLSFKDDANLTIPIILGLWTAFKGYQIMTAVNGALLAFKASTIATTFAAGGLTAVLAANPFVIWAVAIGALVAVGVTLYKNWDLVKAKALELWQAIQVTFTQIVAGVQAAWTSLTTTVSETWASISTAVSSKASEIATAVATFFTVTIPAKLDEFVNFVGAIPGRVATFLTKLFMEDIPYWAGFAVGAVVKFFQELPDKLATWLSKAKDNITNWATEVVAKAKKAGQDFLDGVISFFTQLPGRVSTFITDTKNKVSAWATDVTTKGKQAGKDFLDGVVNFVVNLPGKIQGFLDDVIAKITSWASTTARKATNAGKAMLDNVMDGIKGLPGRLFSFGKDIVDGLINGIANWAGGLWNSAVNMANKFLAGFSSGMDSHSPSRKMEQQADYAGQGFVGQIKTWYRDVKSSALTMADAFTSNFDPDAAYAYAGVIDDVVASNSFTAHSILENDTVGQKKPANVNVRIGKNEFKTFVEDIEDTSGYYNETNDKYTP